MVLRGSSLKHKPAAVAGLGDTRLSGNSRISPELPEGGTLNNDEDKIHPPAACGAVPDCFSGSNQR
jgi:hypothetical protein